jgi:endoglucanase
MTLDAYLDEFAEGTCRAAHAANQPILLRILHEMNGSWFAWGTSWTDGKGNRPNTDENYRKAWIRVHDAFSGRCGHDVLFVWAINHFSVGPGASFTGTYPGDEYVDFIAIDGYNWGTRAEWGWQGFETLFRPGYCAITALTAKPLLVAEIGSSEQGGDKAAWIRDMYARIDQYDRIRGFVWLHDEKVEVEVGGRMDWPVDSSPEAAESFSQGARTLMERRTDDGPPAAPPPPPCGG